MSVIATIAVPADDFTLGAALSSDPGVRVRLERVVPVGNTFIPYFWASNEAVDEIEETLENEEDIDSFRVVDTADDEAFVRVEWEEDLDGFLDAIAEAGATIIEGVGEVDTWEFQLRFDDHDRLTAFYRACVDHGVSVDLQTIHNPGLPPEFGVEFDLTEPQRETLRLALEEGYFDVPRGINIVELAEEMGISDSAVSQRLRRGIATLLAANLYDADGSDLNED